jgi:rRNA processing protein Gar1
LGASLLTAGALAGCGDTQAPPEVCFANFVASLRATGTTVEILGDVSEPFFSVPGRLITVNDEDIEVFEYVSPDASTADATRVSPDAMAVVDASGNVASASWIATSHVYHTGRLIVVYAGQDVAVIGVLKSVLGRKIAGR